MNIFDFREELIGNYRAFSRSFTKILSEDIRDEVAKQCDDMKRYWPEPILQINPSYQTRKTIDAYVKSGFLHPACAEIFRVGGKPITLFAHQEQAIDLAMRGKSYVVTTGTGSGKSLSFFIPIVNRILKEKAENPTGKARTRAIILYPMNALANSQKEEIEKFLKGYQGAIPLTVARYTSQEKAEDRQRIQENPPDILLTNYMMLELVLMRRSDRQIVQNCEGLEFLVLDELHTYRGRQGADVAMLVRRLRTQLKANDLICIGTSATMSSIGSRAEQNEVVAQFASKMFGTKIGANEIIGETLARVTNFHLSMEQVAPRLHSAVQALATKFSPLQSYEVFKDHPLAVWLELTLSITDQRTRAVPLSMREIVKRLAIDAGVDELTAWMALKNFLSQFGGEDSIRTPEGKNPLPFKLHQFISGPGKVYVTLEAVGKRTVTLDGQKYNYDPDNPTHRYPLFEAYFCRDCGQEYIPVWIGRNADGVTNVSPRDMDETSSEESSFGYLVPATATQGWQGEGQSDIPEEWTDSKNPSKIKSAYRKKLPAAICLLPTGVVDPSGTDFWLITGKFRFCVNCLNTYTAQGREKNRLIGLSGEGRSSATTIMTMQILRQLFAQNGKEQEDLSKVLGFVDNRQDVALQAGHFNDFINQLILRSALVYMLRVSKAPLTLSQIVDGILKLFHFDDPFNSEAKQEYLNDCMTQGYAFTNAQKALRFLLSYRLLRDLQDRGFYTCPSLERLGLMSIGYADLERLVSDDSVFENDGILKRLPRDSRLELFTVFLNEVRRRLCIDSVYFSAQEQSRMAELDHGTLTARWSLSEELRIPFTGAAFVLDAGSSKAWPYGSAKRFTRQSPLMRVLSRLAFWKDIRATLPEPVTTDRDAMHALVCRMTEYLTRFGILRRTSNKYGDYYQIDQNALVWSVPAEQGEVSNEFFRKLYLSVADVLEKDGSTLFSFEAEEHTAQVSSEEREELEMRFRASPKDREKWKERHSEQSFKRLPLLFCSPTMELGIDIAALNYVYMRNVPPTAANYVQRAGRAGRSGQQALSVSYCTSRSPHDQWFFNHPEDMVQGVVKEPTIDLSNEALIKNHLHSIWMSAACADLPGTVAQVLDLEQSPEFPVREEVLACLQGEEITQRAISFGKEVLAQVSSELRDQTSWFVPGYVERIMKESLRDFCAGFDGWRSLYNATLKQIEEANRIIIKPGASTKEQQIANQRHQDARRQKQKLEQTRISSINNDFYVYRYLASQGFLPGYNFPAMPLMAWIPAPSGRSDEDTVLSRARFLGLSEFGPRNLIYHRGRIYRIERLKIDASAGTAAGSALPTKTVMVCPRCGYAHDIAGDTIFNVCEHCGAPLSQDNVIQGLFKVSMVETREIEHITLADETRRSQGFEMATYFRFAKSPAGKLLTETIEVKLGEKKIASLTYAPAADVWRVNLGWKYRKNQKTSGFVINPMTGYWRNEGPDSEEEPQTEEDKLQDKQPAQTIVPFVSDTRNILIIEPNLEGTAEQALVTMATLQAAIKRAIEQVYQIESDEVFVEPVPNSKNRSMLLIYESGEGGAGVLRNIVKNPLAIREIAETALRLMHYEKDEGQSWDPDNMDQFDRKASCVAGCYACLLTYYNQPEHELIDRRDANALKFLVSLTQSEPTEEPEKEQEQPLAALSTPLERFRAMAHTLGFKLPDKCPKTFRSLNLEFEAAYSAERVVVSFTPVTKQTVEDLEEFGWSVLDMSNEKQWEGELASHPELRDN